MLNFKCACCGRKVRGNMYTLPIIFKSKNVAIGMKPFAEDRPYLCRDCYEYLLEIYKEKKREMAQCPNCVGDCVCKEARERLEIIDVLELNKELDKTLEDIRNERKQEREKTLKSIDRQIKKLDKSIKKKTEARE